ncbi:MAG: UDP-N-acetylmuramate dehydrogenase [Actinomycetia bacterium]|nr:UDP-N-acetylmuramate dehydrogenase [Actinomycetes bacterium]
MLERTDVSFASLTSLRVGGRAARLIEASTRDELVDVVRGEGRHGCLVLGGGSNLVVSDAGVDVPVIAVRSSGVEVGGNAERVLIDVDAGEPWDALVARCVVEGWTGIEALSGIPGSVGATPIQNVGAYGQEVADVVVSVDVFDRMTDRTHTMTAADCGFGYRTSVFKAYPDRFVVLSVRLGLRASRQGAPVRYTELARRLAVGLGESAPLTDVRAAVLDLRRAKGMVLDDADQDTWSVGSFFTNPVLAQPDVPADAPQWLQDDGRVKTSAAWLIEQAGFSKGFGDDVGTGAATLSTKHTLAVTNRGGATTGDILLLARTVRSGVRDRFGVTLHPEPTLVGVDL